MASPTRRLTERIRRDFEPAHVGVVLEQLGGIPESLPLGERQDPERVQAAVVIPARGDPDAFAELVGMARADWRDVLVGSGFAEDDWSVRLDEELGPA
jgi:hypothetical protein